MSERATPALLGGRDVRALLDRHGLHPTKRRGQNFVSDPNTVRRIVRDAAVRPGDLIVEVGPGLGSLTLALLEAGARVIAVEVDHGLAGALREVTAGCDVTIHTADALTVSYADLTASRPASMVANLPYNLATPILLEALKEGALQRYHCMVQKEVGRRWVAGIGDPAYGAVSVKIALLASARIAGTVARTAFHPVPRVDSVTVDIRPRPEVDPHAMAAAIRLVDAGFAQRRKLLRNALAVDGRSAADADALIADAGLAASVRAEDLAPTDWLALAESF